VVYAGSGLRGYGRLIIIKHSDILLSAYANNHKLLVSVGQSVTQADVISNLGVDGTMYFEIRKDGDPVNPISYLK
jgi:lipoprotein NlpD